MPSSENPSELFGLRLAHVGVNAASPEEASAIADAFCALLGVPRGVEPFPVSSERGHIGLHGDDIDAAQAWYEGRGVEFNEASRALCPDGSGRTYLIYFKEEIAGFAVHLTIAD